MSILIALLPLSAIRNPILMEETIFLIFENKHFSSSEKLLMDTLKEKWSTNSWRNELEHRGKSRPIAISGSSGPWGFHCTEENQWVCNWIFRNKQKAIDWNLGRRNQAFRYGETSGWIWKLINDNNSTFCILWLSGFQYKKKNQSFWYSIFQQKQKLSVWYLKAKKSSQQV